jgi:hypothetical protein
MVVAYNDIVNAIARAEDVALYNARSRAIELSNGCKPSKEDDDKAIEIESWIQLLTRAEENYDHDTCLTDDIIWNIIQNVNEQNRDVDCDVSRTFSRNASSGGGSNVPSGCVERVLGLYVNNTNPSLPIIEIFVDPLTISGDGTQADPFSAIGGGGSQDLEQTLILGNTSGANDIEFDATQGLLFSNTSRLREGTIDAGLGGQKGIAEICGVGFESKWEAGRRYIMGSSGNTIRQSLYNFNVAPTTSDDASLGYQDGSLWTLDDSTTYVCTDAANGIWVEVGLTAGVVEITSAALAALETAGELSLTTIYIVTDTTYRIALKAESTNKLGANGTIIDLVYAGSVCYDVQGNVIQGVSITDSSVSPNQWFGVMPTNWSLGASTRNVFFADSSGTIGDSCKFNTFEQGSSSNTLGDNCQGNTFKQGSNNCIFGDDLLNVTIDAGFSGTDYSDPTDYAFIYNNNYAATIFTDGSSNFHRYYDPANDRIVVTLMSAPFTESYIGGGGGGSLDLEVNGTPNVDQTLLNLIEGTNIDITDNGTGGVTINSLADRYSTSSTSTNTINNGNGKIFTVDANLAYIPLQEVLIVNDPAHHMHGTVTSYSGTTLVVDINSHTGTGSFSSWVINLDGVPVDAITGAGVSNELAYFTSGQVITSLATGTNGQVLGLSGGLPTWSTSKGAFGVTFDGQGGVVSVGRIDWIFIPYNCTITGWEITGDQVGSCVIDVWKDTYANFPPTAADSIAGSEKPTLVSAIKNRDLSLSPPWAAVTAGDCVMFYVDSCSVLTKINLIIYTNIII